MNHLLRTALLALGLFPLAHPAAVQAQSITQALAAAYTHSPDLQSALLNAKSSAEDIVQAESAMRPTVGATMQGNYEWSNVGGTFRNGSTLSGGLNYNQTIFDSFQTDAEVEAARARAEAAEHQIRNAEQNVLLSVVEAYASVLTGRQLLALRLESLEFFRGQLQSASGRLEVGEGTRIEVAQAQARLAQGEAAYKAAVSGLEISEATFQRYVGVPAAQLSPNHDYSRLLPGKLQAGLAEAESSHPAVLIAKAAIRAAQAGGDAAQAAFGPTATINGQVGATMVEPSGTQGLSGRVGFSITLPIYAGGALGSGVRKAKIDQVRSEVDAMSINDQVREAVISAWAGIQSAEAQMSAASDGVSAGGEVLEGVIEERDLGTRTTLDVLNAQSELASARETMISAASNKLVAEFSLLAAMGRLTASELGLPVEVRSAVGYTLRVEDVWQELRTVAQD